MYRCVRSSIGMTLVAGLPHRGAIAANTKYTSDTASRRHMISSNCVSRYGKLEGGKGVKDKDEGVCETSGKR